MSNYYIPGTVQSALYGISSADLGPLLTCILQAKRQKNRELRKFIQFTQLVSSRTRFWTGIIWLQNLTLIHYWGSRNRGRKWIRSMREIEQDPEKEGERRIYREVQVKWGHCKNICHPFFFLLGNSSLPSPI